VIHKYSRFWGAILLLLVVDWRSQLQRFSQSFTVLSRFIASSYKKLSYRRETARQLPTWMEGEARPSSPLPSAPSGYTCAYGRIRKPQRTYYVKRAVRKAHFKMNRAFKVIQGHPYWCRQESRTVCCRNAQLMPTLFLQLTKIMATGKRQIRRFQRPHSSLKTSQQETPTNIYKWFILPETRFTGLHFWRW